MSQVLTTAGLVAVTTGLATSSPGLGGSSESSGSAGLSSQEKKIIIGVVVGVGGFIILGGLALVAWRVGGRKKQPPHDDVPRTASPNVQSSTSGPNVFKSTLDQYHTPASVNTASNF
jgi:hypothetical protein